MAHRDKIYGAIEAGGTKFVCAVARSPESLLQCTSISTTTPAETFAACSDFFRGCEDQFGALAGLGVAAFGPIGVDPYAGNYGVVGATPKPNWSGANYISAFTREGLPIVIDTDVNGAALAEYSARCHEQIRSLAYVTVGTGIGVGVVVDGRTLKGYTHYEFGHIRPRRDAARDSYAGGCPSHGDCLEGLAAGPAIVARWGAELSALGAEHPGFDLEADYLAELASTIAFAHAPQRIVFGGGVMKTPGLLARVRERTRELIGGYLPEPPNATPDAYLSSPAHGDDAGVVGALLLAMEFSPSPHAGTNCPAAQP